MQVESAPLARWPDATLRPGGWIRHHGLAEEYVDPPADLYLRVARETPVDPEALLAVVRTIGGLPLPFVPPDDYGEAYDAHWRGLAESRGLEVGPQPREGMRHVGEVLLRLRVLDICGRVAEAYRAGDHVAPAWIDQATPDEHERLRRMRRAAREAEVWREWQRLLTPALRRWHVRPVVSFGPAGHDGEASPTILEAGALQLMNDLAREADYHVCANETCGRTFARQIGDGGEVFSRRTGVRYCSTACKNAQNQREHRRRAKARREGRSS